MKKIILLCSVLIGGTAIAQNIIPNSGSVGVGTVSPSQKLQVVGSIKADSCVIVGDSLIVKKDARVAKDMKIEGLLYVNKNILGNKDLNIGRNASVGKNLTVEKKIIAPNLPIANSLGNKQIIVSGANGVIKTIKSRALLDLIYSEQCIQNADGTYPNPTWSNKPGVLYAGAPCPPGTKIGVGTKNPVAKVDIRGKVVFSDQQITPNINYNTFFQITTAKEKALVVKNDNNEDVFRVLSNGTVWATEINVDQKSDFPDYVFDDNYPLMPLKDLEAFIKAKHHLPNIPTAAEVKNEGQNIADLQLKQMEKIEELTLYMIQINKRLEDLEKENAVLKSKIQLLKK